ncbi:MAG: peptidylprolyl isomerase [Pseudomonadota bacterium]
MRQLLREPLTHFLFLGSLIFLVDGWISRGEDDPRKIDVDSRQYRDLVEIFLEGTGRQPTPREVQDLIVQWSQNEVLYREALLLGLDQGDEMIRQRLILKMKNVLFSNVITQPPTDEVLHAWFEQNRDAYDRPALYDMEQFAVPPETSASELAQRLNETDEVPPPELRVRRYARRPSANVASLFGPDRSAHVLNAPRGSWQPVETDRGWHLMRVTEVYEQEPADFEKVRSQVAVDWEDNARKQELAAALAAIVEQYQISVDVDLTEPDDADPESELVGL